MDTQKSSRFKQLAIFTLAVTGFGVIANWAVGAGLVDRVQSNQKQKASYDVIVAQSTAQTSTGREAEPLSESQKAESKTEEKKESAGAKKKALQDFRPSEQIEAEQAVDFPYDI